MNEASEKERSNPYKAPSASGIDNAKSEDQPDRSWAIALIGVVSVLPALASFWVSWRSIVDYELLNAVWWYYLVGLHALGLGALLFVAWLVASALSVSPHAKVIRRRIFIALSILYTGSASVSWFLNLVTMAGYP